MKTTSVKAKRAFRAHALVAAGIDLNKDYFALSYEERKQIAEVMRLCGYNYKPQNGRTKVQQFYYMAQSVVGK